jgi:pyruvate dehydrogenase E2 component (dihydrolipoamide acetyltransferase)
MAELEVKLPDMGDEAGNVARVSFWYVSVGERVEEGDDLVQMLTDKATFDVPSPKAGTVSSRVAEEDQEVKVGDVLCRLKVEG